ncbi:MAG: hypothetical protein MR006_05745 [Arcanobacterium sp.]|nr:hypothetical protein [Arcanobacterium sp.]
MSVDSGQSREALIEALDGWFINRCVLNYLYWFVDGVPDLSGDPAVSEVLADLDQAMNTVLVGHLVNILAPNSDAVLSMDSPVTTILDTTDGDEVAA